MTQLQATFCALLFLACACAQFAAVELFVDCERGKMNSTCSFADPCKTLELAIARVPPLQQTTIRIAAGSVCAAERTISLQNARLDVVGDSQLPPQLSFAGADGFMLTACSLALRNVILSDATVALRAQNCSLSATGVAFRANLEAVRIAGHSPSVSFDDCEFSANLQSALIVEPLLGDLPLARIAIANSLFVDNRGGPLVNVQFSDWHGPADITVTNTRFAQNRLTDYFGVYLDRKSVV